MKKIIQTSLIGLFASVAVAQAVVVITEFAYNGSEFVEFTNMGESPVDFTNWRYDDDSASYEVGFDLSGFGTVEPGESVILAEDTAEDFRAEWGLSEGIKVIGGNSNNLGRNDAIVLFNAEQQEVTRLAYGDQNFPGTVRTDAATAWTSPENLGISPISTSWVLSTVGDLQGSYANTNGIIGNPGVYVIPEPSTYAAIAAALVVGGVFWRRRK